MENGPGEDDSFNEAIVVGLTRKLKKARSVEKSYEIETKIGQFADMLREKYPDFDKYRLFHVLAGSTAKKDEKFEKFDFPREDSIVDFVSCMPG